MAVVDDSTVELIAPKDSKAYEHSTHGCGNTISTFTFSCVYDHMTSQRILFEDSMMPMCKDFIDGQNGLVFAYGVTNSGKTYTMQGKYSLLPTCMSRSCVGFYSIWISLA